MPSVGAGLEAGCADAKPQQSQQTLAQKRMAQQQAQVDQVVDIMRSNVEKVIERRG